MTMTDRDFYLKRAQALCSAFSRGAAPSELAEFFDEKQGIAFEHGPSDVAALPFLGRQFKGRKAVQEYFEILVKYLKVVGPMSFSDWTVDTQPELSRDGVDKAGHTHVKAVVTTRGRAKFEYASTGKSWSEQFYYRLELNEHGLLTRYEVWADPLSAYLAAQGQLAS